MDRAGVSNLFEGNILSVCAFETLDAGAFYSSGQLGTAFTNRGNVLRGNTFRCSFDSMAACTARLGVYWYTGDQLQLWQHAACTARLGVSWYPCTGELNPIPTERYSLPNPDLIRYQTLTYSLPNPDLCPGLSGILNHASGTGVQQASVQAVYLDDQVSVQGARVVSV